jgi:hypothetical protein
MDWARAKILIDPMNKDSSDLVIDLCTIQLHGDGMVGAARSLIQPCSHFSSAERFNMVADNDPQEVCTRQPTS